ncbi:MAG: SdrD B-like domain-containing protein, partial [Nitrososphaerales archaeon]
MDIGISRDGNVRTVAKGDLTNVEALASFLIDTPPTLQRSQAVYTDAEGSVRITQIAETTSGTKYVVYALHATNIGGSTINDFRIGAYTDWEAAESSEEDRARYDSLTDTAFQFENAGGLHLGISSPQPSTAHHLAVCCDDASAVLNAPNNINTIGVEDVTVSLAWNLGSLAPAETKTVHLILAAGTNLDDLNSEIADAKGSLLGTIGGKKFHDLNANGIDDNEPGLEGWTINLSGQSTASVVTGPGGFYQFTGLLPGTYLVCERLTDQPNFIQSSPTSGEDCTGVDEAPTGYLVELQSGQPVTGINFGNFKNATAEGDKFEDIDADGIRDLDDPLVSGIRLTLSGNDGMGNAVNVTANTDDNGHYKFEVKPGSYTICEDLLSSPNGAEFFQSFPSTDANCSATAPKGYQLNPQSGDSITGKDFGNYKNAT